MADVTICKRWAVVYDHDGSPVDGCLFVHKSAAATSIEAMPNKSRLRVERVCILSESVMQELLRKDGTA